jgi:hypothetical protein
MRIYVASSVRNFEQVREFQELLISQGHTVTYDWTRAAPDEVWLSGGVEADPVKMKEQARLDKEGVIFSDYVVVLDHERNYGTLIEIGMALASSVPVVIVGTPKRNSVFWYLDDVHFVSDDAELLDWLESE